MQLDREIAIAIITGVFALISSGSMLGTYLKIRAERANKEAETMGEYIERSGKTVIEGFRKLAEQAQADVKELKEKRVKLIKRIEDLEQKEQECEQLRTDHENLKRDFAVLKRQVGGLQEAIEETRKNHVDQQLNKKH